jgi:hypothetical protein
VIDRLCRASLSEGAGAILEWSRSDTAVVKQAKFVIIRIGGWKAVVARICTK